MSCRQWAERAGELVRPPLVVAFVCWELANKEAGPEGNQLVVHARGSPVPAVATCMQHCGHGANIHAHQVNACSTGLDCEPCVHPVVPCILDESAWVCAYHVTIKHHLVGEDLLSMAKDQIDLGTWEV